MENISISNEWHWTCGMFVTTCSQGYQSTPALSVDVFQPHTPNMCWFALNRLILPLSQYPKGFLVRLQRLFIVQLVLCIMHISGIYIHTLTSHTMLFYIILTNCVPKAKADGNVLRASPFFHNPQVPGLKPSSNTCNGPLMCMLMSLDCESPTPT